MRTLRHEWPDIDVIADVGKVVDVPVGSTIVLAPRKEDAEWLNLHRGKFSDRRLKVVLWCDEETALALKFRAPDFSDWIGRRKECPRGLVPFAIRGVRAAFENEWPVAWTGTAERAAVEAVVRAAFPREEVVWLAEDAPFDELVRGMGTAEVVAVFTRTERTLRRARWARAAAGRKTRVVLVTGELEAPEFWPVHDRTMPLSEACERLAVAGARAPGRVAALLDLEPEAVALAEGVLLGDPFHRGLGTTGPETEDGLKRALDEPDAGAALARWAVGPAGKAPWANELLLDGSSPPAQRGLSGWRDPAPPASVDPAEQRAKDVESALSGRHRVLEVAWAAASLGEGDVGAAALADAPEEEVRAAFRPVLSVLNEAHDANILLAALRDAAEAWNEAAETRERGKRMWVKCLHIIGVSCALSTFLTPMATILFHKFIFRSWLPTLGATGAWLVIGWILFFVTDTKEKELRRAFTKLIALPDMELSAGPELQRRGEKSSAARQWEQLPSRENGADAVRLVKEPLTRPDGSLSGDAILLATRFIAETGRAADATRALVHLTATSLPAAGNLRPESGRSSGDDPFLQRLLEQPAGMLSALPEAHLTLVDALLKQGRYPEALIVARGAVERFSPGRKEKAASELAARVADLERRLGAAGAAAE